jgi:hypothetical protein
LVDHLDWVILSQQAPQKHVLKYAPENRSSPRVIKVQQFYYRLGQVLRIPGGWDSQISRQSVHEGGKVLGAYIYRVQQVCPQYSVNIGT